MLLPPPCSLRQSASNLGASLPQASAERRHHRSSQLRFEAMYIRNTIEGSIEAVDSGKPQATGVLDAKTVDEMKAGAGLEIERLENGLFVVEMQAAVSEGSAEPDGDVLARRRVEHRRGKDIDDL